MLRQSVDSQSLASLARSLDESARQHKRMEREHRAWAQRDREAFKQLMAFCAAAGIPLIVEQSKGAELNGNRRDD